MHHFFELILKHLASLVIDLIVHILLAVKIMLRALRKSNAYGTRNQRVRCCYTNQTSGFQIIRIVNLPSYFLERVVCPGKQLFFEASLDSQLEVHSGILVSAVLSDTIPCYRLALERVKAISDKHLDPFSINKTDARTVLA